MILGNLKEGVRFEIQRDGVPNPFWVVVHPAERTAERLSPSVGVEGPRSTRLSAKHPVRKGSPTAQLDQFKGGDKIVAVAGERADDFATLARQLARHTDDSATVSVERKATADDGKPSGAAETVETIDIDVPANPFLTFGLSMKIGPITAIQDHSPAVEAGLEPGDVIVEVDGQSVGDPLTLPARLAAMADRTLQLSIARTDSDGTVHVVQKSITPRKPDWWDDPFFIPVPFPQGAAALGIAYRVENVLDAVVPGSPADSAMLTDSAGSQRKLAPGTAFVKAEFIVPRPTRSRKTLKERRSNQRPPRWSSRPRSQTGRLSICSSRKCRRERAAF